MKTSILLLLLIIVGWGQVHSQDIPSIRTKDPYYININEAAKDDVFGIKENMMSLEYFDNSGTAGSLKLYIKNWKSEQVAIFKFDKVQGLNQYSIDFEGTKVQLDDESIYKCKIENAGRNGEIYEWAIRKETRPKSDSLMVGITALPKQMDCSELPLNNLIEFYSQISGGNAPYTLNWYVLNDSRTTFLYQPREEMIETAALSSMVTVDKAPEYYVMLYATDACGRTGNKITHIGCFKNRKKINSIFIDPYKVNNIRNGSTEFN